MDTQNPTHECPQASRLVQYRRFSVALADPVGFDLARVDDCLLKGFEIAAPSVRGSQAPQPVDMLPSDPLRASFASRLLLLTSVLLQAARVPVFEPGLVLGIAAGRAGASGWSARLAIAHVDEIERTCYEGAIRAAVDVLQWIATRPGTPVEFAALHSRLEREVIPALRRTVPGGESTVPVLRVAHALGVPFLHLSGGIYQLGWGRFAARIDRSMTGRDSALGAKLALNKYWTAAVLRGGGLPVPMHRKVRTAAEAIAAARQLGWPVVAKPMDADRGEGVTVGIGTDDVLSTAIERALARSPTRQAIVEREVAGVCHRILIAHGQLLYAVKRLPISAVGDGQRSVGQLIEAANARERGRAPWLRENLLPNDARAVEAMAAAGFTIDSVPSPGQRVPLRDIESTEWGGVDEDVMQQIHPDNLAIAIAAAELFGLDSAGIDIITTDIGRPWHENGAVVNEVNFAPLLGGGAVSLGCIPEFLGRLLGGDGRIPVEAVVGDVPDLTGALRRQRELNHRGLRCYLTSRDKTLNPAGEGMTLPFDGLAARCRALLLNRDVGALIVMIGDDEVLETGLPIDRFDRVTLASNPRVMRRVGGDPLSPAEVGRLVTALGGAAAT